MGSKCSQCSQTFYGSDEAKMLTLGTQRYCTNCLCFKCKKPKQRKNLIIAHGGIYVCSGCICQSCSERVVDDSTWSQGFCTFCKCQVIGCGAPRVFLNGVQCFCSQHLSDHCDGKVDEILQTIENKIPPFLQVDKVAMISKTISQTSTLVKLESIVMNELHAAFGICNISMSPIIQSLTSSLRQELSVQGYRIDPKIRKEYKQSESKSICLFFDTYFDAGDYQIRTVLIFAGELLYECDVLRAKPVAQGNAAQDNRLDMDKHIPTQNQSSIPQESQNVTAYLTSKYVLKAQECMKHGAIQLLQSPKNSKVGFQESSVF